METVYFSHNYGKLKAGLYSKPVLFATLLLVLKQKVEELPAVFLDYDTNNGLFPLPVYGTMILLIFKKPTREGSKNLFTTIRPYSAKKFDYYTQNIGQVFRISTPHTRRRK